MLNLHKLWFLSCLCVIVIIILYFQAEITRLEESYRKLEYKSAQSQSNSRQFFPKTIEKEDDDLVVIYNRVPKTGSTSFVGVAYDLCKKNHFKVLHINITANMHVMSLDNQYKFAQNVTKWQDMKPALYHGHMAFLNFERLGTSSKPLFINLIRKPLDRLVSYYYFLRNGDNFRPHLVRKKHGDKMTFDECVEKSQADSRSQLYVATGSILLRSFSTVLNNEEQDSTSGPESAWAGRATPPAASFPMQNSSHVKFEPPRVPVIFVLGEPCMSAYWLSYSTLPRDNPLSSGGPGSGKVTHCDNLMQERRGLVHVNMTDLLQQYAIGNDMQDFGTLSSKTVTEVLMLEMKMAPAAKAYLVSGYPRSMRDVAEYAEKIQTMNGAVVVSWRQRVLERQIEYGARLGHVVLSLARMELANFYRHVIPVADYFDQAGMLVTVNGERNPDEVYKDFRAAVLQILGSAEDQTMNGVSGVGTDGIPGEIVGVEPAPVRQRTRPRQDVGTQGPVHHDLREVKLGDVPLPAAVPVVMPINGNVERVVSPKAEVIRVRGEATSAAVLWVVGGPGSNKATLCQRAVSQRHGWMHFSMGQRLRSLAESGGGPASDGALSRAAVVGGELAANDLVSRLVRTAVREAARSGHGLVLDGYPRDLHQLDVFEKEFGVSPRMVLLDCSKLQLGRGRRDGSVAAFRRRLEVFRELSLPMLKTLDQQHRLVIVDGDTDSVAVQEEFTRVVLEEMEKAEALAAMPPQHKRTEMQAQITHTEETPLPHHAISRANGLANGVAHIAHNGSLHNGSIPNGFATIANNKIKPIINNVNTIPTISQLTHDDVKRLYQQSTGNISLTNHI